MGYPEKTEYKPTNKQICKNRNIVNVPECISTSINCKDSSNKPKGEGKLEQSKEYIQQSQQGNHSTTKMKHHKHRQKRDAFKSCKVDYMNSIAMRLSLSALPQNLLDKLIKNDKRHRQSDSKYHKHHKQYDKHHKNDKQVKKYNKRDKTENKYDKNYDIYGKKYDGNNKEQCRTINSNTKSKDINVDSKEKRKGVSSTNEKVSAQEDFNVKKNFILSIKENSTSENASNNKIDDTCLKDNGGYGNKQTEKYTRKFTTKKETEKMIQPGHLRHEQALKIRQMKQPEETKVSGCLTLKSMTLDKKIKYEKTTKGESINFSAKHNELIGSADDDKEQCCSITTINSKTKNKNVNNDCNIKKEKRKRDPSTDNGKVSDKEKFTIKKSFKSYAKGKSFGQKSSNNKENNTCLKDSDGDGNDQRVKYTLKFTTKKEIEEMIQPGHFRREQPLKICQVQPREKIKVGECLTLRSMKYEKSIIGESIKLNAKHKELFGSDGDNKEQRRTINSNTKNKDINDDSDKRKEKRKRGPSTNIEKENAQTELNIKKNFKSSIKEKSISEKAYNNKEEDRRLKDDDGSEQRGKYTRKFTTKKEIEKMIQPGHLRHEQALKIRQMKQPEETKVSKWLTLKSMTLDEKKGESTNFTAKHMKLIGSGDYDKEQCCATNSNTKNKNINYRH